ncbi:MAG: hypothetical protein CMLOHMNK_03399 [Steroidobacteraceae bacterium]|nr:hypothetical protein [Steroidobacteraceae bacterium]
MELALARALHVLGVVIWIGGVSMATTVALPAIRRGAFGADRLQAFHAVEGRFIWQARTAVIIVGLTGFYMLERFNLWWRFGDLHYWWMHAMVGVWSLFMLLLFVGEPFVLHRFLPRWVERDPGRAFAFVHALHVVLLVLSVITVFGAVAGSHGWMP